MLHSSAHKSFQKADLESQKLWVKKLEDIVFEANILLDEDTTFNEVEIDFNHRETDSFRDEIGVTGRETEVSNIVDKLLALRNQESSSCFTHGWYTWIMKNNSGEGDFPSRIDKEEFRYFYMGVCVSDPFKINKILRAIVGSMNPTFSGSDEKEVILRELQNLFSAEKYFLVFNGIEY